MPDIKPYELRAFDEEVQAQADLQKLRQEIDAARAERDRIRDEARREGMEQARREALDEACRIGRERVAGEAAELTEVLRRAAVAIEEQRTVMAAAGERDLVKLALAVASIIVKAEVNVGRPVASENLRRAVELTLCRQELKVQLHPDDLQLIETYLPELRREFSDLQKIALEPNAALGRGGVVVQTREGSVDTAIATQLEEIERGLLG